MLNLKIHFSYTLFLVILGSFDFPALQQAHRVLGRRRYFDYRKIKFYLNRTNILFMLCLFCLLRIIKYVSGYY